ncbi:MAG: sodium:proton antiporter [Balneolaceae bacterium]|nr:MAG: sodium:proton antiporter [Balneolaceae bacterium]
MEHYGIISLVPALVVILYALKTHKTFEALLVGSLAGFVILHQFEFVSAFADSLYRQMTYETIGWIVLVCGLFGSLIQILVHTGGARAFAEFLLKYVNSARSALLATWFMGLLIFIDDYLNALTVGNSMQKVTDTFKISREKLAYVVDSTAAPICVLVPLSTWAIYISGLLEVTEVVPTGQGLAGYLNVIPFLIYAWVAIIIVPLVALKWIPALGPMKRADQRAEETGKLAPPKSRNIGMEIEEAGDSKPMMADFLLPIIVLVAATIYFDVDALKGIVYSLLFSVIWFSLIRRNLGFFKLVGQSFRGFKEMVYTLAIIVMSFVLKDVNDGLGLTEYVIEVVSPVLSQAWLPAVAFISLSVITFATGSFWGVYAITLPIIVPLAEAMGVNIWLAVGAVISAGAFGSHSCFYGDSTVLSSAATGCNNMAHALTQLPYALLAAGISFGVYVALGYWMH